jgi:hypothetical protein
LTLDKCLTDLNAAINKIKTYIGKMKFEELCENEIVKDAILYNLIVVGEVAGVLHVRTVCLEFWLISVRIQESLKSIIGTSMCF